MPHGDAVSEVIIHELSLLVNFHADSHFAGGILVLVRRDVTMNVKITQGSS